MPTDWVRLAQAQEALQAGQRERRGTGAVSGRTERRDRQRLQALALHPGIQSAEDPDSGPKGMQGSTPVQLPGDAWTQAEVCPSYGGATGRRMSSTARFNVEAGLMQVQFDNSGSVYQYDGVTPEVFDAFMAGRLGGAVRGSVNATYSFLMGRGGVRVS
jgi:KTSC domain